MGAMTRVDIGGTIIRVGIDDVTPTTKVRGRDRRTSDMGDPRGGPIHEVQVHGGRSAGIQAGISYGDSHAGAGIPVGPGDRAVHDRPDFATRLDQDRWSRRRRRRSWGGRGRAGGARGSAALPGRRYRGVTAARRSARASARQKRGARSGGRVSSTEAGPPSRHVRHRLARMVARHLRTHAQSRIPLHLRRSADGKLFRARRALSHACRVR